MLHLSFNRQYCPKQDINIMNIISELNQKFPHLNDGKLISELAEIGQIVTFPKGTIVLDEGQYIEFVPLVLDGLIKVKRKNTKGDEVFLYYLQRGESCAMTLSSCLKRQQSRIIANLIKETKILLIPSNKIFFFMKTYTNWSEFVLNTFQDRFDDAVSAIERLAFMKLDGQVMDLLKKKIEIYNSRTLQLTHNSIAKDLCTSRVIISRVLKKLEHENKLVLGHKSITMM